METLKAISGVSLLMFVFLSCVSGQDSLHSDEVLVEEFNPHHRMRDMDNLMKLSKEELLELKKQEEQAKYHEKSNVLKFQIEDSRPRLPVLALNGSSRHQISASWSSWLLNKRFSSQGLQSQQLQSELDKLDAFRVSDISLPLEELEDETPLHRHRRELTEGSGETLKKGKITIVRRQMSAQEQNEASPENAALRKAIAQSLQNFLNTVFSGAGIQVDVLNINADGGDTVCEFDILWMTDALTLVDLAKTLHQLDLFNTFQLGSNVYGISDPCIENDKGVLTAAICFYCKEGKQVCTKNTDQSWICLTQHKRYFPFGPAQGDFTMRKNSEFTTIRVTIESNLPWGDEQVRRFYFGVNGLFSFKYLFNSFRSVRLPGTQFNKRLLAPYWSDLDLISADDLSAVYYQLYSRSTDNTALFDIANQKVVDNNPDGIDSYDATVVLVVTWEGVPPYPAESTQNERVSFQVAIISDGLTTYAMLVYSDCMNFDPVMNRVVNIGYGDNNFDTQANYYVFNTVAGNTGENGYWMLKIGEAENYRARCLTWVYQTLLQYTTLFIAFKNFEIPACHCRRSAVRQDGFWLESKEEVDCYDNVANRFGQYGRRCCYRGDTLETRINRAGGLQMYTYYHGDLGNHERWDTNPKKWCCHRSAGLCRLYYLYRPTRRCIGRRRSRRGRAFGDPHVQTLDSHQYMFNGHGEYHLIIIEGKRPTDQEYINYRLQARTCRAYSADGNITDATIWCAIAGITTNGTTFSAALANGVLEVYLNGEDYSTRYANDPKFQAVVGDISARRENTSVISFFASENIGIGVTQTGNLLDFSFDVNLDYQGMAKGLLGNFNGNISDDFVERDGQAISINSSHARIFDFGQTWQIKASESAFTYRPGKKAEDYRNATFRPIFLDEATPETRKQAEDVCGGPGNLACIFDFVATKDESLAKATKDGQDSFKSDENDLNNVAPVISEEQVVLNTTVGEESTFAVNASDANGDALTFVFMTKPSDDIFTYEIKDNILTGKLTLKNLSNVAISIFVKDAKNAESETNVVTINNCECAVNGTCNYDETRDTNDTTEYYTVASCKCDEGYTGDRCEEDEDGCSTSPCPDGTNCTDIKAENVASAGATYKCSQCPSGYLLSKDGTKCLDVDECKKNDTCDVNAKCTNKIGSYFCTCNDGYRDSGDGKCVDKDECAENSHTCAQMCNNTVGSYSCYCQPGFEASGAKGHNCTKTVDPCKDLNSGCTYGCLVEDSKPVCFCQTGYKLAADKKSCENINECENNKLCSQKCTDTDGSYTCSCYTGFTLDDDKHSCTICQESFYGVDCKKRCDCRGRATKAAKPCHNVNGCQCDPQWTGTFCNQDVDECLDPNACPTGQICTNTKGSFTCTCPNGYQKTEDGQKCEDIDECASFQLHKCPQQCKNNPGTFNCFCNAGYEYNAQNNTCDDINECLAGVSGCGHKCVNNIGSFNCECLQGFKLDKDRKTCLNAEEVCKGSDLKCSFACTLVKDQPTCICSPGYYLGKDDQTCVDVDECSKDDTNECTAGCKNTAGSYNCTCPVGQKLASDERTCKDCENSYWGLDCKTECGCSPIGAARCDKVTGCVCKDGYTGDDCSEDIDECNSNTPVCKEGSKCVNLPGSFRCDCNSGFELVNGTCKDINECLKSPCDQECKNTDGSYQCVCSKGFTVQGDSCIDIDECASTQTHNCEQVCRNTQGNFACGCTTGFIVNTTVPERNKCMVDPNADKCKPDNGCETLCFKKDGNDVCSCSSGYKLNADGKNCDDIDECLANPCKGEGSSCQNSNGGFTCTCPKAGTKLSDDKLTCVACTGNTYGVGCVTTCTCDWAHTTACSITNGTCSCQEGWKGTNCDEDVDECSTGKANCGENSNCVNSQGSFSCNCNKGFLFSSSTKKCQACDSSSFGQDCKEKCQCKKEYSTDCNDVTGQCTCIEGWKGVKCDENVNECVTKSDACPDKEKECKDLPGTFECVCLTGYTSEGDKCIDIDECIRGTSNCTDPRVCSNTDGGFKCVCGSGYTETDGVCIDNDECSLNTDTCDKAISTCRNTNGSFACDCIKGYTKVDKKCVDIDECATNTSGCVHPRVCNNTVGSFQCVCDDGYEEKGDKCEDKNECNLGTHTCVAPNVCKNTIGSFECDCADGFTKDGNNCADLDECALGTDNCSDPRVCNNTAGSFECPCKKGYTDNKGTCIDDDECSDNTDTCDKAVSKCRNTNGAFECDCNPGYKKVEDKCVDIDECSLGSHNCSALQVCKNTVGSFECPCKAGYTDVQGTCTDDDECVKNTHNCVAPNTCKNTAGSFECTCAQGFTKDGNNCKDNDECALNTHNCTGLRVCNNTIGSFECVCKKGYTEKDNKCIDDDECSMGLCDSPHTCNNTAGSYDCTCASGFSKIDGKCVDVDECKTGDQNCVSPKVCSNTVGSFKCVCDKGYTEKNDKCEDDDECQLGLCASPNKCTNKPGSYDCVCAKGYSKKDLNCLDDDECALGTSNCKANSVCNNTAGAFECPCVPGYNEVDGKCGENFNTYALNVTFNFNENITETLRKKIEEVLQAFARKKLGKAFVKLIVIRLRKGSVIADSEVQIDKAETTEPASEVVKLASTINEEPSWTIDGKNTTVGKIVVNNAEYKADESPCVLFTSVSGGCKSGFKCVEQQSLAVCVADDDDDGDTEALEIGLGVGVPLFVILCVIVGVVVYLYMRGRTKTSGHGTPSVDRDAPFRSMFASRMAPKGSWGPQGRMGLYSPDAYSEAGTSDTSHDGDSRLMRSRQKVRSDFQDSPWYDNHGMAKDNNGANTDAGAPTSNFSWEYMFRLLEPHRGFEIQRPNVISSPNPAYEA